VILSLHNTSTETQAPSRLAVLRSGIVGGRSVPGTSSQAYWPSLSIGFACTRRGTSAIASDRMLALPLFAGAFSCPDPRANAKQEGIP
jgi:hypothetical protein